MPHVMVDSVLVRFLHIIDAGFTAERLVDLATQSALGRFVTSRDMVQAGCGPCHDELHPDLRGRFEIVKDHLECGFFLGDGVYYASSTVRNYAQTMADGTMGNYEAIETSRVVLHETTLPESLTTSFTRRPAIEIVQHPAMEVEGLMAESMYNGNPGYAFIGVTDLREACA